MGEEQPKKWLVITPAGLSFTQKDGDVWVWIREQPEFGLAPGLGLAVRMTPMEARGVADRLTKWANAAETTSSRQN